jgi:hypothetical protein
MAMVPLVLGGAIAGGVTYQVYNPPEKQAPEGRGSMPRNLQDWRLTPQDAKLRIPNYWRNHARPASEPIEDAYRSTYNNIYTNGPKLMRDAITGNLRIITPDGNSTNDTIIDHPVRLVLLCCFADGLLKGFGQEVSRPRQPLRSARNKRPRTMPTK